MLRDGHHLGLEVGFRSTAYGKASIVTQFAPKSAAIVTMTNTKLGGTAPSGGETRWRLQSGSVVGVVTNRGSEGDSKRRPPLGLVARRLERRGRMMGRMVRETSKSTVSCYRYNIFCSKIKVSLLPFRIMMTFAERMLKDLEVGAKGASLRFRALLSSSRSSSCALPPPRSSGSCPWMTYRLIRCTAHATACTVGTLSACVAACALLCGFQPGCVPWLTYYVDV
jgi:hypothetical protein